MNLSHSDRTIVNHFLNGELSGLELENFLERLAHDTAFKSEVDFQQLLRSGILFSKEEQLKKKIRESIHFRKARVPFALKMIVTFVFFTIVGITLWFYVGVNSVTQERVNSIFHFLAKEKPKDADLKSGKNKVVHHGSEAMSVDSVANNSRSQNNSGEPEMASAVESSDDENKLIANDSTVKITPEEEPMVIKKDQLLISVSLPVNGKPTEKEAQEGVHHGSTENVLQKLNPAAGIPEDEVVSPTVEAEFWVSPVNYRGYKMSKNKLILFGIEEPDAVKLFRSGDILYMKYGNDFFRLTSTFDFLSYQRLRENDVPLTIRQ